MATAASIVFFTNPPVQTLYINKHISYFMQTDLSIANPLLHIAGWYFVQSTLIFAHSKQTGGTVWLYVLPTAIIYPNIQLLKYHKIYIILWPSNKQLDKQDDNKGVI